MIVEKPAAEPLKLTNCERLCVLLVLGVLVADCVSAEDALALGLIIPVSVGVTERTL